MEIKKVTDYSWQIPKQGSMKVPAIIYASEKLLQKIKEDKTIEQIKNVASLNGIIKAAYAMPDAHQGYGFPIGGVAAFDMDEGVISPGGVGFDINCLKGDSRILTEHGYYKQIKDFESDFSEKEHPCHDYILKSKIASLRLVSFDYSAKLLSTNDSLFFMKKEFSGKVLNISSKLGYNVTCTSEHPILTDNGMVHAGLLNKSANLAVNPFSGIEYEKCPDTLIIDENHFPEGQRRELKKRGLLPLSMDNEHVPIIAKLFGYLLYGGNISFANKKGMLCAYGRLEDLKSINEDFKKLGFSGTLYPGKKGSPGKPRYNNVKLDPKKHELHVSSISLVKLFYALGYPENRRASQQFHVPGWILTSPGWIKRLFISALFGAASPQIRYKKGFCNPSFSISQKDGFVENGRMFCIQLMAILDELDVKTDKISQKEEYCPNKGRAFMVGLNISAEENNLVNLWSKVGFTYNAQLELLSKIALMYIQEKRLLIRKRTELAQKTKELRKKGLKLNEVQSMLNCGYANNRFIEIHYYRDHTSGIEPDFQSFEEYKSNKIAEYEMYGLLFDRVESIEENDFSGFVYDLNIEDTHNFIANNIVVSNCGVRLLRTGLKAQDILSKRKQFLEEIYKQVPSGVGRGGVTKVSKEILAEVLEDGASWAVKNGYGFKDDLQKTEEYGKMKADPSAVSERALSRGIPQLGTLGAGNHFLEIQKVDSIFNEKAAKSFGLTEPGQVTVMIHCGSRGLGHQVASDYITKMESKQDLSRLADRELINAPINSEIGIAYYRAMCASVNFAFANRQMITHWTRNVFEKVFGEKEGIAQVYDVCHNIAKFEKHLIEGEIREACVHRKGATRSFGPGRKEIPEIYRDIGQPVIIPGSMGTASYVLIGTKKAEEISFGSTAHGAGRVSSRAEALRTIRGEQVARDLSLKGIEVKGPWKGLAEEAPEMYKDIDEVVRTSDRLGIGNIVARLVPLAVMKG